MEQPELKLICKVYNINAGKNRELLEQYRFLKEYAIFEKRVRGNYEANGYQDLEWSIEEAIDYCIYKVDAVNEVIYILLQRYYLFNEKNVYAQRKVTERLNYLYSHFMTKCNENGLHRFRKELFLFRLFGIICNMKIAQKEEGYIC